MLEPHSFGKGRRYEHTCIPLKKIQTSAVLLAIGLIDLEYSNRRKAKDSEGRRLRRVGS